MSTRGFLITFIALCSVFGRVTAQEPASAIVAPVATYTASYQASANGLTATARRILTQLDNGSYELVNELEATVLDQEIARLQQRSRFHYAADSIRTDSYSYQVSGVTSDQRSIEFDWQAGTALSTEDTEAWVLELRAGVFDPLSHQFALSQQLALDQSGQYQSEYEFAVIDGDEIESHRYQLVGEEVLDTPLGKLNTVKLERIRSATSSRSTIIWLAPDWQFLVARIEQVDGSLQMQLVLETADIGGAAVTALLGSD